MGGIVSAGAAIANICYGVLLHQQRKHYQLCGIPIGRTYGKK